MLYFRFGWLDCWIYVTIIITICTDVNICVIRYLYMLVEDSSSDDSASTEDSDSDEASDFDSDEDSKSSGNSDGDEDDNDPMALDNDTTGVIDTHMEDDIETTGVDADEEPNIGTTRVAPVDNNNTDVDPPTTSFLPRTTAQHRKATSHGG